LNNLLVVSTGIQSLDDTLGGGLAVGSILLVEEDVNSSYGRLFVKYFIAEGIITGHEIFLSSADMLPQDIVQTLPSPVSLDSSTKQVNKACSDDVELKIAWRYKHQLMPSEYSTEFGHYYDISQTMPTHLLDSASMTLFDPLQNKCLPSLNNQNVWPINGKLSQLLCSIEKAISAGQYNTKCSMQQRNVLRIALDMIGSTFWMTSDDTCAADLSLSQFLCALRSLLRSCYAVCILTVPTGLHQLSQVLRLEHLSDFVVRLKSLNDYQTGNHQCYSDYNGLLDVVKLPHLNGLTSTCLYRQDLAFRIRRKRFTIEKLHLPPTHLSDTTSNHSSSLTSACASNSQAFNF
jgi:elongator complex protein 4